MSGDEKKDKIKQISANEKKYIQIKNPTMTNNIT